METIKPGSAHHLKQMLLSRSSLTSPTPDPVTLSLQHVSHKPQAVPRKMSAPNTSSKTLPIRSPTVPLPLDPLTASLEASTSPPRLPQNYVEPTAFLSPLSPDPTASLPVGLFKRNGHPPVLPKRPNHTYSHKPRNHHKLSQKSSSEVSIPQDCGQYEIMDPDVVEEVPQPVAAPRPGKPVPKPRSRSGCNSASTRGAVESPSSQTDDILDENDDGDYLLLVDNKKPTNKAPVPSERRKDSVPSGVAEQLMQSFNQEQLGSLIQMLQQVQGQSEKGVEDAWSTDGPNQGPETSLRGNFSKCIRGTCV